jgi:glycosyltransferase involved in cell wall biosynthesis
MLAKKLIEAGHDVQIISFKKQYPQWLYPGKSDKDYSKGREEIDAEYLLMPLNPMSWNKVVKAIDHFQPQKVVFTWWVTFWAPAYQHIITQLKKKGILATILVHNTMPHESAPRDQLLARIVLKKADRFIVMTQKEKIRLLDLLPNTYNIDVVPHPISRIFKPSGMDKIKLRSKFGLPADQQIMLFFGFVRPYKGLDDLLEAHKILINEGQKIRLAIAGEFWENINRYRQKIDSLGLTEYINIYNKYIPDDEAAQYFEMSDLFVAPYRDATQSGVIKAALGFGMPIVLTDIVVDEIITNFPDLCKIVPSRNPQMLAKGIQEQLMTPHLGNEQITKLFNKTWDDLIKSIFNNE